MGQEPPEDSLQGKRLAATVYNSAGQPLLKKGVTLTSAYVRRLKSLGYTRLLTINELAPDLEYGGAISAETSAQATAALHQAVQDIATGKEPDIPLVEDIVDRMLEGLDLSSDVVEILAVMRSTDDSTFVHSVNVTALTLLLARQFGFSKAELRQLGVGALLHDVGKIKTPPELLTKPGPLTDAEYEEVKRHTSHGFELLRRLKAVPDAVAQIAHQHHERLDGTGYPQALPADKINLWARLAAVADVYDALTADRPYRTGYRPDQALKIINEETPAKLDAKIVQTLRRRVAAYPVGTVVQLSSGLMGVVARQTAVPTKPVVRVLATNEQLLAAAYEEDLSKDGGEDLQIIAVLPDLPAELYRRQQTSG